MSDNDPILIGREWHFEDGTVLPLVSGGALDDGGEVDSSNVDPTGEGLFDYSDPNPSADDLASPFLSKIPDADKPVVAKYLKEWQGGVTKRFQSIHEQYKPFKDVDREEFETAMSFFNLANESPERVIEALLEAVPELGQKYKSGQGNGAPPVGTGNVNPWAEQGVPDDFAQEHLQLRAIVEALAEQTMGQQNAQHEAEEDAELDDLVGQMHDAFGDFNEESVLLKMANGMDPESAVSAWADEMQQYVDSRRSPRFPPPVMGGNGSVASGGVEPSKLGDKDRKAYIASALESLQANS